MSFPLNSYSYPNLTEVSSEGPSNYLILSKASAFDNLGDYFPLQYSDRSCNRIKQYLEDYFIMNRVTYRVLEMTPEELNQARYLVLSIEAFFEQDNKYDVRVKELIPRLMSFDGQKFLKRQRLKSFVTTQKGTMVSDPTWWNEVPSIYLEDIGEVYNYNYSMFWEAPDEKDYLLSQTPVDTEDEYVNYFKKTLKRILKSCIDFDEVSPNEILLRSTSSMSLFNGVSKPNFTKERKDLFFSEQRKEGKRVLITTGPGQGRDAIINDIRDLNTIQLINENVRNFLNRNFSEFLIGSSVERFKKKYFKRCKKSKSFFCRDIRKEGITKPKWILYELLKALHEKYPNCFAFKNYQFYDGPWYEGDKTQRGHGLGMANELTTFMQIVIYYTVNFVLGVQNINIASTGGFFLNDDAIIFFDEDEETSYSFVDEDFSVCEGLGILAQRDKSFYSSTCCVFCETYFSRRSFSINRKQSYMLRESKIILRSSNILEAKFYIGNMKGSLSQIEELLGMTYSKLGYEFHKDEFYWPVSFGGIRTHKILGVDRSLDILENIDDYTNLYKAYRANLQRRLYGFNKYIKLYKPPIFSLYPSLLKEENEEILDKLGLGSEFNLACTFFRPSKEHKFHSSMRKLFKKRREIYDTTKPIPINLFLEEYSSNSLQNVALNKSCVARYIKVKLFTMKDFKDPYKIVNPISSYLKSKGLIQDDKIPASEWGLFQTDSALAFEKSVFQRIRAKNTLSLIDRFEEDSLEPDLLVFPEDDNDIRDFMECYPRHFLLHN